MSSANALRVAVLGEYIRSWRVQDLSYWIAQAMRPCRSKSNGNPRGDGVRTGDFAFSRGEGIHDYDNVQSSFLISYNKPLRRNVS